MPFYPQDPAEPHMFQTLIHSPGQEGAYHTWTPKCILQLPSAKRSSLKQYIHKQQNGSSSLYLCLFVHTYRCNNSSQSKGNSHESGALRDSRDGSWQWLEGEKEEGNSKGCELPCVFWDSNPGPWGRAVNAPNHWAMSSFSSPHILNYCFNEASWGDMVYRPLLFTL